jgi:glycosyltransferase involved in cell wall biosynthesis
VEFESFLHIPCEGSRNKVNNSISIALIVPVHNEELIVEKFICEVQEYLKQIIKIKSCIYVVNDGSTDLTLDALKRLQSKHKNIVIINLRSRVGKLKAQAIGARESGKKHDLYIFMDGDGQHDPSYINDIVEEAHSSKCDVLTKRTKYRRKVTSQFGVISLMLFARLLGYRFKPNLSEFICITNKTMSALANEKKLGVLPLILLIENLSQSQKILSIEVRDRISNTTHEEESVNRTKHSVFELFKKGLFILFNDPYKALFRILTISTITIFTITSYGLYIGIDALFNDELTGVASIILVQITLTTLVLTTSMTLSVLSILLVLNLSSNLESVEVDIVTGSNPG